MNIPAIIRTESSKPSYAHDNAAANDRASVVYSTCFVGSARSPVVQMQRALRISTRSGRCRNAVKPHDHLSCTTVESRAYSRQTTYRTFSTGRPPYSQETCNSGFFFYAVAIGAGRITSTGTETMRRCMIHILTVTVQLLGLQKAGRGDLLPGSGAFGRGERQRE